MYINLYIFVPSYFLVTTSKDRMIRLSKMETKNIIFVQATRYEMRLSKNVPPRIKWHT